MRDAHKELGLYWGRQRALGKGADGYVGGRMRSGPGGGVVALVPASSDTRAVLYTPLQWSVGGAGGWSYQRISRRPPPVS